MNTPTLNNYEYDDVIHIVRNKAQWLTTLNKRALATKHGMTVKNIMLHLRGAVKKPSYDLLCDALDMIRVNEKKILTRL